MSKLCSLPWCRKPIPNRSQCVNFPTDRPSQLAWLDALDAGAWFSIPQETLATGLILCGDHFDKKGNVKHRYDDPYPASSASILTVKRQESDDDDRPDESDEDGAFKDDNCSPSSSTTYSRKRSKEIKVKIIHQKKPKKAAASGAEGHQGADPQTHHYPSPSPSSTQTRPHREETSNSIDPEKLSKFTEHAINSALVVKNNAKAQRASINLSQKMEMIRLADSGLNHTQIAKKMNMKRATISKTISLREKIEQAYNEGCPLRKKVRKGTKFEDINQALYAWYQGAKSQNLFLNTRVLLTMAENIGIELGRTDFKCSHGWLDKFKLRYNIRFGYSKQKSGENIPKAVAAFPEGSDFGESMNSNSIEQESSEVIVKCEPTSMTDTDRDTDSEHGWEEQEEFGGGALKTTPVRSKLTTKDAHHYLINLRNWAVSKSCPLEIQNALSTVEAFILEQS